MRVANAFSQARGVTLALHIATALVAHCTAPYGIALDTRAKRIRLCGYHELEVLVNTLYPGIDRLLDPTGRLASAEMLFDAIADDLTDLVTRVPQSAPVDCTAAVKLVASDMQCHVAGPANPCPGIHRAD